MSELGKTLAQARVARGLSLEDCERDTRISKRYLDALEREDWRVFPAPVYSRAFLRTYAQYLGLDPSTLMRMYQAQEEPELKPLPEVRPPSSSGSINWPLAGVVVGILLVAGAFFYFANRGDGDGAEGVTAQPTQPTEAEGGGPPPVIEGRPVGEIEEGVVPDLSGVRVEDAMSALQQAQIEFVIVETETAQGTPGIVVTQDPAAGTEADDGTSVTLVVPAGG